MGFLTDVYAATALTDMYFKLLYFEHALKLFGEMSHINLASLNAMISGVLLNGSRGAVLWMVRLVNHGSLSLNSITIVNLLSACTNVAHGVQRHCWAIKMRFLMDVYVATALLTMYSTCGEVCYMQKNHINQ